ncbi:TonB-dependent receptor [Mariniflexile sp.]|uniref:TonB-dependent receptor n=1 Tax=Mariniflexile sp. TaxID=1979402 RepID=UPI0040471F27
MNKIFNRSIQERKKTFKSVILTIMRVFVLFITIGLSSVYANSIYSQEKIDINVNNISLEDLFKEIQKKSEYIFFYKDDVIDDNVKISITLKNAQITEILNQSFAKTDLDYVISDRQIVVKKKPESVKEVLVTKAQKFTVSGTVKDSNGQPLPGATVIEKGTQNGAQTDFDGQFNLEVKNGEAVLVVSYIGFATQEIAVGNRKNINVALVESVQGLDEVVVTGYGTRFKTDVMSSISSVKAEEVTKVVSTDLGEMLRGKAAGVQVSLGSAAPGSSSDILIRGTRSLGANNAPIIIVDGVTVGQNINSINPADINSIDILKDAAAQAIYGARAANGVILITTKTGTTGKAQVSYSGFYGIQSINPNFDLFTPQEYIQLKREAYRTVNNFEYQPDEQIFGPIELESIANGKYINWRDQVLKSAAVQNHTVSLSSGTEKTKIYASANYRSQDGVIPNTDFKEANLRLNMSQSINDWVKVGINSSAQISQRNNPSVDQILARLVIASPLGKIYNDDGTLRLYPNGFQDLTNPLLDIYETSQVTDYRNDLIHLYADFSPFKGFNYRVNASRRSSNQNRDSYETALSAAGVANGNKGEGGIQYSKFNEMQIENILTYNLEDDKNSLDVTFVQSVIKSNSTGFNLNFDNTSDDVLGIYGLATAEILTPSLSNTKRSLLSFVGRVEYNYLRKYYLTASARADGSSVFGPNNKWAYFPAVSLGWNIYKEPFLENSDVVSNLKLRASYGSVGNEAILPYTSIPVVDQKDYIYGNNIITGYAQSTRLANPNIKWETTTTANVGVDFGFWKNRISGTFEYYNTSTTDLLIERSLPADTGRKSMYDNIGEVQNKGIELNMNAVVINNNDLKVQLGFNFTRNRNKIVDLYGTGEDDIVNKWFIGQPINVYYTQLYDRIWQADDDIANSYMPNAIPGQIKVKDKNNDNVLDSKDQYIISQDPDWYGTFSFNLDYRGIDFSADVMTVQGVTRLNPYLNAYKYGGTLRGDRNQIAVSYWTPENTSGYYPSPQEGNDPAYITTMGYEDASYVRLQNITLGYSLPNEVVSKLNLTKLRFYVTGQNLVTWTDFLSYSPEKDPGSYPEAKIISAGLQVNF